MTFSKQESVQVPDEGLIPILTASNISEHGLQFHPLQYVPAVKVSAKQRLRRNDVLITASSGSLSVVGRAARFDHDMDAAFGAFCKVLRPSTQVDPNYFLHFFRTPSYRARVSELAAGANINNLRNEDLDDLVIPLPPLPEQRRIAAILDQVDELRAKRRRALRFLDESVDGRVAAITDDQTWPTLPLAELAAVQGGLTVNRTRSDRALQVDYLRVANVSRGAIDLNDVKQLGVTAAELDRVKLTHGDILIVEGHGNADEVGRAAAWNRPDSTMVHQNHLIRVRPRQGLLDSTFLEAYLNSRLGRRYFRSVAKTTSGLNTINMSNVRQLMISAPPIAAQNDFARWAGDIDGQRILQRAHLAKLDEVFASLQGRAFGGSL